MDELWFCGEVIAPDGLGALAPLLEGVSWPVEAWRSGYDGSDVLRGWKGAVHLDMDAGQGAGKLFSGTVDADPDSALRLLGELSAAFREAGMRHRIELYAEADGELLGYLHHGWPRGE
ncbi:MAG TPA: hypothetical protein VFY65_19135 [Longimicrobium sp.]|nr:hypothetical protein [Longimicrobium sp.]